MRRSAGILLYKMEGGTHRFFLVHPGGPFWKNKDLGAWSIPKGEFEEGEEPLAAAIREFKEETGMELSGDFTELTPVKQKSGKLVMAWSQHRDVDASKVVSNTFDLEWPPRSGKWINIPEVDKGGWFTLTEARQKIITGQAPILNQLAAMLQAHH